MPKPAPARHLPKLLKKGLGIVFCGTAAGAKSAERGAYYAGPGNKFWSILATTGLTPRQLAPAEFRELLDHGIGLTDLVPHKAGMDKVLRPEDFDTEQLRRDLAAFRPRILAFNGKLAASIFCGVPVSRITYGLQPDAGFPATAIHVLPSTSGAACRTWDAEFWRRLARA